MQANPAKVGVGSVASCYLNTASHFMVGLEELDKSTSKVDLACCYLASHILEITLKAYLSHKGVAKSKLKDKKLRHNLSDLWDLAVDKGAPISSKIPLWCKQLNSMHDAPKYHLRYSDQVNGFTIPGRATMVPELKQVLDDIRSRITTKPSI